MTEAPIPSDPDWLPFEPVEEPPVLIAIGKEVYQVIAENEQGWKIIMPLNMVILDPTIRAS